MTAELPDEYGIWNYVALILRPDHPQFVSSPNNSATRLLCFVTNPNNLSHRNIPNSPATLQASIELRT